MDTIKIQTSEEIENSSHIILNSTNKRFEFRLKNGDSLVEGYCDLTEEESKAFDSAFKRMITNVERVD